MSEPKLTVLSYGAGQDSTTILYRLAHDPDFRETYAPGRLLVLMSDTGDEHPETYRHVADTRRFCKAQGIEFHFITAKMGFHSRTWQSLRGQYRHSGNCGSKGGFKKSCSDKLKIQPIYKFLDHWLGEQYGYQSGRKRATYSFVRDHGRIRVLLGIAAGEESRVENKATGNLWMDRNIDRVYPLIDIGFDRQCCQDYIKSLGYKIPMPSNCMLCPFVSERELLWLHTFYPKDFQEWVQIERVKLEKFADKGDKNHGVFGAKKTLPMVLAEAKEKFGHMTKEQLTEWKMSHGHCVKSKF